MKRILVPTDFSEQAAFAMDLACQMAHSSNIEIVAMHVLDHTGLFDFCKSAGGSSILWDFGWLF